MRCYGGPMHGKDYDLPDGQIRFACHLPMRTTETLCVAFRGPVTKVLYPETVTYCVERFRQVQHFRSAGAAWREKKIAVLEGADNLLPHEHRDIQYACHGLPWSPVEPPDFIAEFKRWFAWTAYKVTHDESYIIP